MGYKSGGFPSAAGGQRRQLRAGAATLRLSGVQPRRLRAPLADGHLRRLALSLYPGSLCGPTLGLQASHLGNMAFGLHPGGLFLLRKSSQTPLLGLGRSTLPCSKAAANSASSNRRCNFSSIIRCRSYCTVISTRRDAGEQRLQHIFAGSLRPVNPSVFFSRPSNTPTWSIKREHPHDEPSANLRRAPATWPRSSATHFTSTGKCDERAYFVVEVIP